MPQTSKIKAKIEPIRLSIKSAAAYLDCSYDFVHDLVTRRIFTVLAPRGRGNGKRIYIPVDELKVYALAEPGQAEEAVRAFRYVKAKGRK